MNMPQCRSSLEYIISLFFFAHSLFSYILIQISEIINKKIILHPTYIDNIKQNVKIYKQSHTYLYKLKYLMLKVVSSLKGSLFSTLVLAQHNGKSISKNTLKLLSASNKFGQDTHVLLTGANKQLAQSMKSSLTSPQIKKIITLPSSHPTADVVQHAVQGLITENGYKRVIGLSSSYGKDVIPRLAGKYMAQPISDITQIIDNKTFVRPTYAGNVFTKVKSQEPIDFLTIRPSAFPDLQAGKSEASVQQLALGDYKQKAKFVSEQKSDSNKPQLTTARIVISGGRGVKSKQNFDIIYKLADAFGDAAVGASRAAVDAGYCPNQMQVGQTGKVVAPDLYIAVGISGAVQHLAGMKDSKCIVAINTRPDEPIFQIADYGLEADLFKVLPELTEKVKKIKSA